VAETEWIASSESVWRKLQWDASASRIQLVNSDTAQKRFRSRLRLDLSRFPNRPKPSGTFLSGLDESARRAEVLERRPSFLSTNAFVDLEDSEPEPEF